MPINARARSVSVAMVVAAFVAALSQVTSAADNKALSIEMPSAQGRSVRLADLKGKVVLVKIWASWCDQCKEAYPKLAALDRELRSRGVVVVAINVDEKRKQANAFLDANPSDMLVTFDPRGRVLEALGVSSIPTSFVIDRSGVIRYRHSDYTAETLSTYRREIETLLAAAP